MLLKIQTDSSEVARQFDSRVVRELPVQDRNVQEFVGLMTGVTPLGLLPGYGPRTLQLALRLVF